MFKLRNFLLLVLACAAIIPLGAFWFWTERTTAASTAQNVEEKHLVQANLMKASLTRFKDDLSKSIITHLTDNSRFGSNTMYSLKKAFGLQSLCMVNPDNSLVNIGKQLTQLVPLISNLRQ